MTASAMARDGRPFWSYAALMQATNRVVLGVILAKQCWFGTEGSEVRILSPRPLTHLGSLVAGPRVSGLATSR